MRRGAGGITYRNPFRFARKTPTYPHRTMENHPFFGWPIRRAVALKADSEPSANPIPQSQFAAGGAGCKFLHRRGFALVITLSLMVLLTLLAVGLLTLSSVNLRSTSQGEAMQTARANARLALLLAIGQVQQATGPDQRITTTADQRSKDSDGRESSAAIGNRHWTGVYRSWPAGTAARPDPQFISWLVSGTREEIEDVSHPESAVTATDGIELVGDGTLGRASNREVKVPAIRLAQTNGKTARLAWWVGDQGVKASLATPPPSTDQSLGTIRRNLQAAPRNSVEITRAADQQPFVALSVDDTRLERVVSWQEAEFLASGVTAAQPLFHDVAAASSGLLTNVTAGGFRKDLSLQLERPVASLPRTPLYTVRGENGINLGELGVYYNSYKEINRSGSYTFTTSGRLEAKTPHLLVESSAASCANDDEFHLKQPAIISYQLVLSFKALSVQDAGVTKSRLYVVVDPIVTMWNPLDLPVVVPTGSFISVKYWQVPYDIVVRVNAGAAVRAPLAASLSGSTSANEADSNFISIQIGKEGGPVVFKPGEVIKFSQSGNLIQRTAGAGDKNQLIAKKGFNHGGGFAMPLRDLAGKFIDLNPTDRITYEAYPNKLTGGKTSQSGNSVTGGNAHSRHFSITHHEVYVGPDRGEMSAGSLGYGGMFIDWDFGNKRLKPGEVRQTNQPGTKPANERLYADRFPRIFKPLTSVDARPLSYNQLLANKSPFLLLSYDAKTEYGSETGTRSLARFNPRAHFFDFYDLSQGERDMMPYEFRAEPLVSWANRSLDLSPDGSGFFGGGMTAQDGVGLVCTHSIPREPIVSLAAFQHSFANGFEIHRPVPGYAILNSREPMQPQISHAIGNSMAPPMIDSSKFDGVLSGGRPLADHSYLANRALWDEWFLSGIAPQSAATSPKNKDQKTLATEFFNGKSQLPVVRYRPATSGEDVSKLITSFFSGAAATDVGIRNIASYLRVDGLFNVNSTSVEAWKAVLGGLKGRPIVTRDASGKETISAATYETPVTGLGHPQNLVTDASGNLDIRDPSQWVGRRELTEVEIEQLAKALVIEVRKRGPFLSLADFVNRRVGRTQDLARAGAIQSALDSATVEINKAFISGTRAVGPAASRFIFPAAEKGPVSFGIPGLVKQGDILTPIAPVLSVRSDSFIIRAYGEAVDGQGKVIAQAWCEAVIERDRDFVDPTDKPEALLTSLNPLNKEFGRRYEIVSFRWLSSADV